MASAIGYAFFLFLMTIFSAPYVCIFRGMLTQNWVLLWSGIGILTLMIIVFLLLDVLTLPLRRRQRAKLLALCTQMAPTMPLALQAESLSELDTWMRTQKDALVPDVAHRRSLSRVLLHGLETPADTPVQGPPLLVYCARKWPTDAARTVFSQLQEVTRETDT
jgi:hypothetical protein